MERDGITFEFEKGHSRIVNEVYCRENSWGQTDGLGDGDNR